MNFIRSGEWKPIKPNLSIIGDDNLVDRAWKRNRGLEREREGMSTRDE